VTKSCKAFLQIISSLCFSALFRGIYSIEAAELRLDGVDDLAGKIGTVVDSIPFLKRRLSDLYRYARTSENFKVIFRNCSGF